MTHVTAEVQSYGGVPAQWVLWGRAKVKPGDSTVIGSGMGPMFTVNGVAKGATFQYGRQLNAILRVNGQSSLQFQLFKESPPGMPAPQPVCLGTYKALVY